MAVLLTYDIRKTTNEIHTRLKERLKTHFGYSEQIQSGTGKWYSLPNTSLRKANITTQQAAADFLTACKQEGAEWEKYIAVDFEKAIFDNR